MKKMNSYVCPDNYPRELQVEHDLNHAVSRVMASPEGQIMLAWLKSITTDRACGSNIDANGLFHLEGQRYLVGVITKRAAYGKEGIPRVPDKPTQVAASG